MEQTNEVKRMQQLAGILKEETAISYTAVVLTKDSHNQLLALVPEGWDSSKTSHHCTLNMGKAKENIVPWLDKRVSLRVLGFATDDKVCAVKVELPSGLTIPGVSHITVAITNGGKPFLAGKLDYSSMSSPSNMPSTLEGIIKEVPEGDYSLAD